MEPLEDHGSRSQGDDDQESCQKRVRGQVELHLVKLGELVWRRLSPTSDKLEVFFGVVIRFVCGIFIFLYFLEFGFFWSIFVFPEESNCI